MFNMESSSDSSDWRLTCKNVQQKMKYLLANSLMADITIRIVSKEPREFRVHSLILSMASAVFERSINSNFKEGVTKIIELTDVKPEIFHLLLQYIYGQTFQLTSMQEAWELFAVADYYLIYDLKEICIEFIENIEDPLGACLCVEMAEHYNLQDLKQAKLQVITRKTKDVLMQENFVEINEKTVSFILEQEKLSITEFELFKCIERWIKVNLAIRGEELKETFYNLFFPKFRFFAMTPKEFIDGPLSSGLMKESDMLAVIGNMLSSDCKIPLPDGFQTTKRICTNEVTTEGAQINIESFNYRLITLAVNRDLKITGINIFTLEGTGLDNTGLSYEEAIAIKFKTQGAVNHWDHETEYKGKADNSCNVFVPLNKPVQLLKGKTYDMYIQTRSGSRKTVNLHGAIVKNEDVSITFFKHPDWYSNFPIASFHYDF